MTDNQQDSQTDTLAVPVVLRVWRDGGGVLALFPTLPSDEYGRYCDAYAHVGQHGGADYWGCVQASRPATAEESADLIRNWSESAIGRAWSNGLPGQCMTSAWPKPTASGKQSGPRAPGDRFACDAANHETPRRVACFLRPTSGRGRPFDEPGCEKA